MRNICLTCRTFCSLAQPLLYHTLDIRPFTKGPLLDGLRSRISLRDDVRDEVIERLSFIASDKIAPYVRNISVDFAQYGGGLREDGCNAILTSLVHRLHRFVGLQKLTFAHNLCLRPDEFILPPCASRPILPLTEYVGPRALLPLLSETPTLHTLLLISIEESGFDDCVRLMPALSCNIVSRVTDFTAKIDTLTEGNFRVILSKFSCLAYLSITVETPLFADASVVPVSLVMNPSCQPSKRHILFAISRLGSKCFFSRMSHQTSSVLKSGHTRWMRLWVKSHH